MAASTNSAVLTAALLIAIAISAPNLQPSAATRVHGGAAAAKKAAAKAAYKEDAAGAMLRTFADQPPNGGGGSTAAAQPTECRSSLMGIVPCADFLTNPRVPVPGRACCSGFDAMFTANAISCVCHIVNGDIDSILQAPMQEARMLRLFPICGHDIRVDLFAAACYATILPPIDAPTPLPSPPAPTPPSPPSPGMMESAA